MIQNREPTDFGLCHFAGPRKRLAIARAVDASATVYFVRYTERAT